VQLPKKRVKAKSIDDTSFSMHNYIILISTKCKEMIEDAIAKRQQQLVEEKQREKECLK
jgi:hypothetical protein